MRAQGQDRREPPKPPPAGALDVEGWTKQELVEAAGLSPGSFDAIRKAARIRGPSHGGMMWVFSAEDVLALVQRAASGRFSEIGGIPAAKWRAMLAERGVPLPEVKKVRRGRGGHGRSR